MPPSSLCSKCTLAPGRRGMTYLGGPGTGTASGVVSSGDGGGTHRSSAGAGCCRASSAVARSWARNVARSSRSW
eukprot:9038339-Alexandrium_andersonii.AAC.1